MTAAPVGQSSSGPNGLWIYSRCITQLRPQKENYLRQRYTQERYLLSFKIGYLLEGTMSRDQARDDRRRRELQHLQLTIAEQQAEITRQVDKSPSEKIRPVVGMPADVVRTLKGYRRKDAIKRPERWGWNRLGLIVKWFYPDLTLTLKRTGPGGRYEVTEVEEVERGSDV